jgi:hypothetical protein
MIDFTKIQMASAASSNKILLQGTGSFAIPSLGGAGQATGGVTIPHSFGSDNLLFQVGIVSSTSGAVINPTVLPWGSTDNRLYIYASVDSTNLYINGVISDSSGFGNTGPLVNYSYRILVP